MSYEDAHKLLRRNRELSILNAIAEALNRSVDLPQALEGVLRLVAELLSLRTGWIWLLEEDTGEPYLAASQFLPPALANEPERMTGSCYCLDTFEQGDLTGAANVNVVTCSRLKALIDGTDGLRYHASIPIYSHTDKLGVLNVASADWRELDADDLRLLYTIGYQLGVAIERARLYARSAQLAKIEERNRLAREIHDTLAQGLAAISLQLESADALIDASPTRAKDNLRKALDLARLNLEEARRSVLDLRAAPLLERSLPDALRALAETLAREDGVSIDVQVQGAVEELPGRIEAGVYRIAQEALNNAARHSGAERLVVSLSRSDDRLRLTVEDDGQGFEPGAATTGFGLIGMRERARLLGGTLEVDSLPNRGTRILLDIPV
ncbi:MAG TPA: GAF domain-containing sensor histidine kinase [Anaerolineae bacterium]|nr:GAF domain-containing sensor histidine kinase [Anaerolineae bacterium]